MSGRRSRDKGARGERAIVRLLQGAGIEAQKISRMYQSGADLRVSVGGVDRSVEVKVRANGFRNLDAWLTDRDLLVIKADRQEPLVILRLSDAIKLKFQ